MRYHCEVAIDHFTRKLSRGARRGKPYQAVCVLHRLWLCAGDPWADSPVIHIAGSRLAEIAPHSSRRANILQQLVKLGAVRKLGSSRRGVKLELLKPPPLELDEQAQAELEHTHRTDYRCAPEERTHVTARVRKRAAQRGETLKQARARQRKRQKNVTRYLASLGRARSDVRDALAATAGTNPNGLLYFGSRATAVSAAAEFMTKYKWPWKLLLGVCRQIREDDSPDKPPPESLPYLFELDTEAKRKYLARMVTQARAS